MLTYNAGDASTGGFLVVLLLEFVILGALASVLVGALHARVRGGLRPAPALARSQGEILALRFARGEFDSEEFQYRLDALCRGASR